MTTTASVARTQRSLRCGRAGDVLVLHPDGADQPALRAFAASLAADPEHTLVVLGGDYPVSAWVPVLPALASCPGSLRLVPGSPAISTAVEAGPWLAGQLARTVLAQDGPALPAARGALFIPAAAGSGWLRFRPGKPAAPGSRRFPAPRWTCDLLERTTVLGAAAIAEPLPGGAWIRPPEGPGTNEHRQRLISWLAWQDDRIYVTLGYPDAAPLPLGEVGRFWRLLPPPCRAAVRFVPYGPVAVPDDVPLGQALATLLGETAVVCTGLPWSGRAPSDVIHVRALHADGSPGWPPFATEVSYQPGRPVDGTPPPEVTAYRPPVAGLGEVTPGVYGYERDTVIEVVPAGLWLRPAGWWLRPAAGTAAESIARSHPLDPDEPVIFVDTAAPEEFRMASLTSELVNSLDPEIQAACRVLAATPAAGPPTLEQEPAGPDPEPARLDEEPAEPAGAPAAEDREDGEPDREQAAPDAPEQEPSAPDGDWAEPHPPAATSQAIPPKPPAPAGPPAIRLESGPRREPAGPDLAPMPILVAADLSDELAPTPPAGTPGLDLPRIETAPVAGPVPSGAAGQGAPSLISEPPIAQTAEPAGKAVLMLRVQPVPAPEACVIPPSRGLTQERTWLRRTLSRQYDATASLVGRVLAENPGLRSHAGTPPADLVTDLVALRLYLSGHAQHLDDAVRAGTVGPHVPFGRCVAAGLRRLPSYRGATRLRATLADAEWQWYHGRHVVTEWAFCSALASGHAELPGTAEFRIWSMTGRRTSLLEPGLPAQVLFLPGTSFKVLQVSSEGQREVLLRELSANEIGTDGRVELDRVPLDDIALTGLEQARAAWAMTGETGAGGTGPLPAGYEYRFGNPPGLIVKVGAGVPRPAAQSPGPGQVAT